MAEADEHVRVRVGEAGCMSFHLCQEGLLGVQRYHRIDLACAAGWDITGKQSNLNQCGQYRAEDFVRVGSVREMSADLTLGSFQGA